MSKILFATKFQPLCAADSLSEHDVPDSCASLQAQLLQKLEDLAVTIALLYDLQSYRLDSLLVKIFNIGGSLLRAQLGLVYLDPKLQAAMIAVFSGADFVVASLIAPLMPGYSHERLEKVFCVSGILFAMVR